MFRPLAAAVLTAVVVGMPTAAFAAELDFRLADDRITESSGLALSVRHPHTVWTVNDSGDRARVFAVDTRTGMTVGVHTFDSPVRDVEALAITRNGRMLVADIGDNTSSRDSVRVYSFDEPELGKTSGPATSWELAYPDGPHDAESLAVNPATGLVHVVTKGTVAGVYALRGSPTMRGVNRLERVASAPARVTDAVFLPDGSVLVVRTYTHVHSLESGSFLQTVSARLPLQPQGETLTMAPDGRGLLVGSEGKGSRVQQVPVPGAASTATDSPSPSTTATPPGVSVAPTPVDPPSVSPKAALDEPVTANRGELLLGIGGTALLVGLAVLLTWAARRSRR